MDNYIELISDELTIIKDDLNSFCCDSDKLKQSLLRIISAPSKKIRPIVALLYLKSIGVHYLSQNILSVIETVELIHTAALIHDDVIDNSKLRRGVETINFEYDNEFAVIAGDFLLTAALQKILDTNSLTLFKLFNQTFQKMCIGEAQQFFFKNTLPNENEYIQKSLDKTATLFKLILNGCGLFVSDFDFAQAEIFAENFGIAFQIKNDLDSFVSQGPNSDDSKQGIFTLPYIYIEELKNKQDAIEKTEGLIHNYLCKAINSIHKIPDNDYKTALCGVINWIIKEKTNENLK